MPDIALADTLAEPLPVPVDAVPKPDLRSAAAILAGKKRKPKKLKRTPHLFDYLSDEQSDDWEDVQAAKLLKRPKTGRAVDGKLESGGEEASGEGEGGVKVDSEEEREKKALADKLVPKSYQKALLECAQQANIVTVLQTGSGKTLVGVLLIDWIHSTVEAQRREAGEPPRLSFFLTNSVPLVHQQADTIARNTKLRVGKLFGALGVNLCSEKEWEWNFAHYDCLVVTAQLILDSLAHGFLKMEQISLLVLDEAHHSKASHPFASILRDFYHRAPKHKRPRILGLTASPLNGNAGIDEAKTLEKLLDAKLVTAPLETQAELRAMAAVPTLLQMEYDAPPVYARTELFDQVVSKVIVRDETFDRYYAGAETVLNDYGPDAADLVWHLALERCRQKLLPMHESDGSASELEDALLGFEMDVGTVDEGARRAREKQEERRRDKARMKKELRERAEREVTSELPDWLKVIEAHTPTLDVERFSPKLRALVEVLKACKDGADSFRGIIFVNRRLDALILGQIIRELAKVETDLAWINVDCVTGHGTAASNSLGPRMQWHEQADVLSSFAEGRINLLLATSVVEEGLDVQPCNTIVRFDMPDTHISYVQSRGRARASGSHYLVFLERDNVEHKRKLLRIAKFDEELAGLLSRAIDEAEDRSGADDFFGRADETSVYIEEPTTGALLTPHFALSLLLRYCGSLPKSDEFSLNKPLYTINDYGRNEYGARQYSCTVQLPSGAKVRVVTGGLRETPKLAKRQAAYTACIVLRNSGCLDEHLLPPRFLPPDEVVDVVTGAVVGPKKRQIEYEHKLADAFLPRSPCADVTTLHVSLLHYGGDQGEAIHAGQRYRPVVLFTRNRLPDVPPMTMFVGGEALLVYSTAIGAIDATAEQRKTLTGYSVQLWQTILNKVLRVAREEVDGKETRKELDLVYFVGVLRDGVDLKPTGVDSGDLDWAAMERAVRTREEPVNLSDLERLDDSVIVDQGKKGCRYFFERVRDDLGPNSKLPPGRQSAAGFETLMDYYLSFDEGFFHTVNIKDEQPLLEVSRMPKAVTHLTRTPRNDVQPTMKKLLHSSTRFAIPQIALVHFLPASIFRTAYMLPSIIHDLEQRCLVVELNERLFTSKLDHKLVRTALTTPSASVGADYNRLELLGDAFLKYMASTACFVTHERTTHEGTLHRARLEQINNSRLADSGKATNLPAYLASRPFTSRQFLPPNLLQLSAGPAPPTSAVIGDKTIADAVEALMGAGMEGGYEAEDGGIHKGFDLALEVAKALGLELGNVTVWDDFARLYGPPAEEAPVVGELKQVEAALGYTFKHASLVIEALTHPSKLDSVSFERCEWLGDSVLDFCVLRQCWKKWGGELSEGTLTELKGACVSNETLAALAVELNLDRFLIHSSDGLALNMRLYRERIVIAHDKELAAAAAEQRPLRPYWLCHDPPKAVADIVESAFGAVYLDSRFDPAAVQRVFDHSVAPWLARWISPTTISIDSVRLLLEHAQSSGCYDVSHVSAILEPRIDHRTGELIHRLTRTSVVAHNMVLSTVESGNPKTAKRISSSNALAYLDANPGFFSTVCDCASRRDIQRELALEELERLRGEGLLSEPESDDDEWEAAAQGKDVRALETTAVEAGAGEAMAVDA